MPFNVAVLDEAGYGGLDPDLATRLCAAAFSHRGFDVERLGEVSVALVEDPRRGAHLWRLERADRLFAGPPRKDSDRGEDEDGRPEHGHPSDR
jgi:hypothetical protein